MRFREVARKRVAVLISGRGSNMLALARAAADPTYPATIVAVLSDRPDAAGLDAARAIGIWTGVVPRSAFSSKVEHEAGMIAAIEASDAQFVCLAGYMRLLSRGFVSHFAGRMINIHPSLLPAFPGLNTHARALAAGVRMHGCTAHYVTDEMDAGPVIAQAEVPVEPDDTPDTLAARVLAAEHLLYPQALATVLLTKAQTVDGYNGFSI